MTKAGSIIVNRSNNHGTNHHEPVRYRNVDLSMEAVASVDHPDMREVAAAHDLRQ